MFLFTWCGISDYFASWVAWCNGGVKP